MSYILASTFRSLGSIPGPCGFSSSKHNSTTTNNTAIAATRDRQYDNVRGRQCHRTVDQYDPGANRRCGGARPLWHPRRTSTLDTSLSVQQQRTPPSRSSARLSDESRTAAAASDAAAGTSLAAVAGGHMATVGGQRSRLMQERSGVTGGSDAPSQPSGVAAQGHMPYSDLPPDPLLAALLSVVRPLEEAGYAYMAVQRTAAWLHGATLPPPLPCPGPNSGPFPTTTTMSVGSSPTFDSSNSSSNGSSSTAGSGITPWVSGGADLELEVQWDQMQTIHALFSRPLSGWTPAPLQPLPGGRATFTMTTTAPPAAPATAGSQAATVPTTTPPAAPAVTVSISCTFNTVLRANPTRVLITPKPTTPPPSPYPSPASPTSPFLQSPTNHTVRTTGGAAGGAGSGGASKKDERTAEGCTPTAAPVSLAVLMEQQPPLASSVAASSSAAGGAVRRAAGGPVIWSQSLYGTGVDAERRGDRELVIAVEGALRGMQRELSTHNTATWGRDSAYDAWVSRFGTPPEAASRLMRDPARCLGPLLPYLTRPDSPPLSGLRVANLLGSHGHKAVALAALGAEVTVLDASPGNATYARQLAAAAGLTEALSYIVCDVAELQLGVPAAAVAAGAVVAAASAGGDGLPQSIGDGGGSCGVPYVGSYDVVLMELGVLHYFLDLRVLMRDHVAPLLRPGGRLLLREFHPVSTKLLSSKGKKHKATGDYFLTQPLVAVDVSYSKYEEGQQDELTTGHLMDGGGGSSGGGGGVRPRVLLRRWGLGEVVNAVVGSGQLGLVVLDEEAGARLDDAGLPKLFTLLAEKK